MSRVEEDMDAIAEELGERELELWWQWQIFKGKCRRGEISKPCDIYFLFLRK